jgi:hypothetical protein
LGFPSAVIERWFPGLYRPQPTVAEANKIQHLEPVGSDKAPMINELIARATRRGWTIPENFAETMAIYADEGALAAMLEKVWRADALDDMLSDQGIDAKKFSNG